LPKRSRLSGEELAKQQKAANEEIMPHWTARNGVLHYDGKANSLQTDRDYGDFELWVDWKIGRKGDSGIYLRGNPQVQIWDPEVANPKGTGSGGLFNNEHHPKDPSKLADKPVGEWNTFRIVMRGEKVSVWLNGELVVDNVTWRTTGNARRILGNQYPLADRSNCNTTGIRWNLRISTSRNCDTSHKEFPHDPCEV